MIKGFTAIIYQALKKFMPIENFKFNQTVDCSFLLTTDKAGCLNWNRPRG